MRKFLCGLKYIFIPVLCIFMMSHNVGALTLTDSVDLIRGNMVYQFNCLDCSNFSYAAVSNYGYTRIYNPNADIQAQIRGLQLNLPSESYLSADYLTLDIFYTNDLTNNSLDAYFKSITTTTNGWDVVDVSFENLSTGGGVVHITFKCYTAGTYTSIYIQSLGGSALYLWTSEYISSSVATHWRPKSGVNYTQAIQNVVNAINSKDYSQTLNNINNSINNINDDVEDATQDAADDSATAGDQSSADAATATTGFISAIGGFVSAITNATPSNCNINANLNHLNLGVLDLCSMPVPSYITIIGSIIAIMLVIPFCIVMFNRFIGLFRSFQG